MVKNNKIGTGSKKLTGGITSTSQSGVYYKGEEFVRVLGKVVDRGISFLPFQAKYLII